MMGEKKQTRTTNYLVLHRQDDGSWKPSAYVDATSGDQAIRRASGAEEGTWYAIPSGNITARQAKEMVPVAPTVVYENAGLPALDTAVEAPPTEGDPE